MRQRSPVAPLVLLLALVLAPFHLHAADNAAGKPLGELYAVAQLMDAAVLDLNMLLGEQQSPAYKVRLDETLKKLDAAMRASVASLGTAGIPAQTANALADNVAAFSRLARLNRDNIMKNGFPENAMVDEMMQRRQAARTQLDPVYADLEKRAGLTGSPLSEARALALQLQQMSALYVENASAAYVSNRSQDSTDVTIDQLAMAFAGRLAKLESRAKGEEALKRLQAIKSKWKFIERSMMNYQENTVPFLVDRYTQAIVVDLIALAETLK